MFSWFREPVTLSSYWLSITVEMKPFLSWRTKKSKHLPHNISTSVGLSTVYRKANHHLQFCILQTIWRCHQSQAEVLMTAVHKIAGLLDSTSNRTYSTIWQNLGGMQGLAWTQSLLSNDPYQSWLCAHLRKHSLIWWLHNHCFLRRWGWGQLQY
jgi:hypothetical protein